MRVEVEVLAGPMRGARFDFSEPDRFVFGRAPEARCSLPQDPFVSRYHFLLEIAPPLVSLHDLGSKNGTLVNGLRYGGRKPAPPGVAQAPEARCDVALRDGDEVSVGDTRLRVRVHRSRPAAPAAGAGTLTHPGAAHLAALDTLHGPTARGPAAPGPPVVPGYEVLGVLGEGGMGQVLRARERSTGREVAIKTLLPRLELTEGSVAAFRREMDLTGQLSHPHLVRCYGSGVASDALYLVLELVEGPDLAAMCAARGGRLPLEEAGPLVLQALAGIGHAHRARLFARLPGARGEPTRRELGGLVHRDLKPQNILVGRGGSGAPIAKVADFGLAKVFGAAGLTDMTKPGEIGGTPRYWPAEQITGYRHLQPTADVFAMGAVLFEVLTGRPVRRGFEALRPDAGFHALCFVVMDDPPIPVREHLPDLPPPVAAVVDRALSTDPAARYVDGVAMHEALADALTRVGL